MQTLRVPADREGIIKAVRVLAQGGLVAFPTETVYGLGANALDSQAVLSIFRAKGRPADNPLIAHVSGIAQAREYGRWGPLAQDLAQAFWPGPLTLIVERLDSMPSQVSAGLPTLALRLPGHEAARALITACGFPLAAPSANRSGRPSPTTAQHVLDDLEGLIPLVLDGGPSQVGLESTVVDVTGGHPRILRPGAVTPEMIAMAVGECQVADAVMRQLAPQEAAPSPGMRHRHYAPRARMTLVEGPPEAARERLLRLAQGRDDTWVLALEGLLPRTPGLQLRSLGRDAREAAHRLFHLLREADQQGVRQIYAQTLPRDGLGLAVMNRLARAANFNTIQAGETPDEEPMERKD
ncbi:MAG: threonylcarbamoyl-AMP synthase [Clostridiales bacterium]|nr:threonylcarbamoyl-AMP synthase [Clostridiales bacterium]